MFPLRTEPAREREREKALTLIVLRRVLVLPLENTGAVQELSASFQATNHILQGVGHQVFKIFFLHPLVRMPGCRIFNPAAMGAVNNGIKKLSNHFFASSCERSSFLFIFIPVLPGGTASALLPEKKIICGHKP